MHARTNGYFLDSSVRNRFSSGAVCGGVYFLPRLPRSAYQPRPDIHRCVPTGLWSATQVLHRLIKMPIVIQRGETPVHVASRARCCPGKHSSLHLPAPGFAMPALHRVTLHVNQFITAATQLPCCQAVLLQASSITLSSTVTIGPTK